MFRKSEKISPPVPPKPSLFRYATLRTHLTARRRETLFESSSSDKPSELKKNSSSLYIINSRINKRPQTEPTPKQLDNCSTADLSQSESNLGAANKATIGAVDTQESKGRQQSQSDKLEKIIDELVGNELKYVAQLKKGIEAYGISFNSEKLPADLVNKKYLVFSNIELIYEFHAEKFLPELQKCGYDLKRIAETFIENIKNNFFNLYILYAQHNIQSQELCVTHRSFFKRFDYDGLGINSFLLLPIQRMPRYLLMLDELVKELLKNLQEMPLANKAELTLCCYAEKELNIVNDQCK